MVGVRARVVTDMLRSCGSRRSVDFCALSPSPRGELPCAYVTSACFADEAIFLHGPEAARDKAALDDLLAQSLDLYDAKRRLRASERGMVHVAQPGAPYMALPLSINARLALAYNDTRAWQRRQQPVAPTSFSDRMAIAFVTTWSNAFTEAVARAAPQLFEAYCAHGRNVDIIPAAWGSTDPNDPDQTETYLAPLSAAGHIQPMSLMAQPPLMQQAVFGNRGAPSRVLCPGNVTCLSRYLRASERYFAKRGQRCFRRAAFCNLGTQAPPHRTRPWSLMQAIAAHHAGAMPASFYEHHMAPCAMNAARRHCTLRVVYIQRPNRRRLHNIDEHVAACNAWGLAELDQALKGPPRATCRAHNFSDGLVRNLPLLRHTDVLIGPHGADMTNGLALHAGATLVELLPPISQGCPCTMYQSNFAAERRILHYTAGTKNRRYALNARLGYNADFVVPVAVTRDILAHVVKVGGSGTSFRTTRFDF